MKVGRIGPAMIVGNPVRVNPAESSATSATCLRFFDSVSETVAEVAITLRANARGTSSVSDARLQLAARRRRFILKQKFILTQQPFLSNDDKINSIIFWHDQRRTHRVWSGWARVPRSGDFACARSASRRDSSAHG